MLNRLLTPVTRTAALAAVAGAALIPAQSAHAVDKWWNIASGNWATGANWLTAGVPANTDNVFIGNTAAAQNAFVQLNTNATIANLTITDGMYVFTNTSKLTVTGATTLSGSNSAPNNVLYSSSVVVEQGAAAVDFQTGTLTITDDGGLEISGGATVQVGGLLDLQEHSSIYADGIINLTSNSPVAMRVDGILQAAVTANGLTINQLGTGLIDLDGTVADGENGGVNVTGMRNDLTAFANLTINGTALADAFDDYLWISAGNTVSMNLSNGWTLGPSGIINFSALPSHSPKLEGSHLTVLGRIKMTSDNLNAELDCPLTFEPSSRIELDPGSRLYCDQAITVHGGTFTLDDGSFLYFSGDADWNGTLNVTGNGTLFTHGTMTVSGTTTINAHAMKLDGSGIAQWNVQNPLTINAASIDFLAFPAPNSFDGVMTVSGGASSRLTMNLTNPGDIWNMGGTMNLSAPPGPATTRLAGTPLSISGVLHLGGSVRTDASYGLYPGSLTTFAASTDTFENSTAAIVFAGANFSGTGSLVCGSSGLMTLGDGSTLGSARLTNRGNLDIDFGVGQATVGGFTQTSTGTYNVDIGGSTPGTRHDHLVVAGNQPAVLGGMVDVDLVDAGDGPFIPHIGDSFTILTSRAGLQGTFAGVSSTLKYGVLYQWSLVYDATTVKVQLDSTFVRCPADFNGDGFVDGFDYDDFVACFEGDPCPPGKTSDFNGDGFPDGFDYDDFVAAFEAGC